MKPAYIAQLPQVQQQEIEKMLEELIRNGCGGNPADVERYHGTFLAEAVQNGNRISQPRKIMKGENDGNNITA